LFCKVWVCVCGGGGCFGSCVDVFVTCVPSGVPKIFFGERGGGSTNSEDRGQRKQGSGGGSPLVRGSAQFANE
jgi:hypothetical protein